MCRRAGRWWWLAVVAAAMCFLSGTATAETARLELKRLDPRDRLIVGPDLFLRISNAQTHFSQLGLKGRHPRSKDFSQAVHKEPKYEAGEPVRGVFQLGGQTFGFALDATAQPLTGQKADDSPPASNKPGDAKAGQSSRANKRSPPAPRATRYNRLYFDRNRNGDLTDDPPVDGKPSGAFGLSSNYAVTVFPVVELKLQAQGTTYDYAFFVRSMSYAARDYRYVQVSLEPAVYRHGTITLDGQSHEVFLTDFNANGRFDDAPQMARVQLSEPSDGRVFLTQGDILMFGSPTLSLGGMVSPYDVTTVEGRHPLSKLLCLKGRFYEVQVPPSGEQLTLTPTRLPMGSLRSPHRRFQALLYGELGFVKVVGSDQEIPIPAGQWRIASYTLDLTAERQKALAAPKAPAKPSEKSAAGKEPKGASAAQKTAEGGLLSGLARSLVGLATPRLPTGRGGPTILSATMSKEPSPITVRPGQRVELPFGPPFTPIVRVDYATDNQIHLGMTLVGSAGESCTNLLVDGTRPSRKPEFTIRDPQGNVVQQGSFEYG